MIQIKMVKNGNRTLIAIDGATEEQDRLVQQIITTYTCSNEFAEQALTSEDIPQITCISPPTVVDDLPSIEELDNMASDTSRQAVLISSGGYAGMSPSAILYKDGVPALLELFRMACQMKDGAEKAAIVAACKNYLKSIRNIVAPMTDEQRAGFMKDAVQLYTHSSQISSLWSGYKDVETFLTNAPKIEKDHAFEVLLQSLEERGKA